VTYYLAISALQEPNDLGPDPASSGRVLCGFNVLVTKRPSASFVQELIRVLVAAGVGIENASIFGSSKAVIPDGPGPYLEVKSTGGTGPLGTHDGGAGAYRRPSAQLIVHAASWPAAEGMALAAYDALLDVRNTEVA
jgi:hypothetical protein